ncbi:VOC family protein [Enterovibrio sp. 27052020O]|uniref:VOC family protein n=1 Tax=Enterovibrio sp. 27052020O TaxID=3241166 RepID=UPI00388E6975
MSTSNDQQNNTPNTTQDSSPQLTHGAPSWIEHCSEDFAAARQFYQDVLGWQIMEHPMLNGSTYPIIAVNESGVGGFKPFPDNEPGWLVYITVDDVDARYEKALSLGGTQIMPPSDIPSVGRLAIFKDPQGAKLALIKYDKSNA